MVNCWPVKPIMAEPLPPTKGVPIIQARRSRPQKGTLTDCCRQAASMKKSQAEKQNADDKPHCRN